jgi:hypothetical protein
MAAWIVSEKQAGKAKTSGGSKSISSYSEVGHIFETIVLNGAKGLFGLPTCVIETSKRGTNNLSLRLKDVLVPFSRSIPVPKPKIPDRIKDGGLDVVARLWEGDHRPGVAHFLIQCSAGDNWRTKLTHPVLARWTAWVNWRGPIYRGFAVPTLFGDDQVLEDASRDGEWTLLLDRVRIMRGLAAMTAPSANLQSIATDWCQKRLPALKKQGLKIA